jgi:hypothetical protein
VTYPSEKYESQLGLLFPILYMEKENHVPNHQPDIMLYLHISTINIHKPLSKLGCTPLGIALQHRYSRLCQPSAYGRRPGHSPGNSCPDRILGKSSKWKNWKTDHFRMLNMINQYTVNHQWTFNDASFAHQNRNHWGWYPMFRHPQVQSRSYIPFVPSYILMISRLRKLEMRHKRRWINSPISTSNPSCLTSICRQVGPPFTIAQLLQIQTRLTRWVF